MIETNETLLARVKQTDSHDAWRLFYEQYWAVVLGYARKLGLDEHQGQEVLQETMVTLMRVLPAFQYDRRRGQFRNFLFTIVHRKSLGVMRRTRRERHSVVPWSDDIEHESKDPFENGIHVDEEADKLWKESLLEEAIRQLRCRRDLGKGTFAVFEAYVLNKQPVAVVAERFGLQENAVYQIKNRLLRFLRAEIDRLTREANLSL